MQISPAGIDLIKRMEGLRLKTYRDITGRLTIGYGHLLTAQDGPISVIDLAKAEALLAGDCATVAGAVTWLLQDMVVNQNQFDALCDFCYNLGAKALEGSTLLKLLKSGDTAGAAKEFPKWDHTGENVVSGLFARRMAEKTLFLS